MRFRDTGAERQMRRRKGTVAKATKTEENSAPTDTMRTFQTFDEILQAYRTE